MNLNTISLPSKARPIKIQNDSLYKGGCGGEEAYVPTTTLECGGIASLSNPNFQKKNFQP
jgi:hypothetical protein